MNINKYILGIFSTGLLLAGCNPSIDKKKELPAPSAASFVIEKYNDPDIKNQNSYIFTNTTPGSFISAWDFGGVKKSKRNVDTVFFAYKGKYTITLNTATLGGITTSKQDVVIAENSPYAADFTILPDGDQWHYKLAVTTPNPKSVQWTLPSLDTTITAPTTSIYWPWKGPINVTLTVVASNNGKSSITKTDTITSDDPNNPALTDDVFTKLTGGITAVNGKTWKLVQEKPGKAPVGGVGPMSGTGTDYYTAPGYTGAAWDNGAAKNEYTFVLRDFQFKPKTTDATIHFDYANTYFGKSQAQYADIAIPDPKLVQGPYVLKEDPTFDFGTGYGLDFTTGTYLGYNEFRYHYQIMSVTDDTLYIRQPYNDDSKANPTFDWTKDANARYFTYAVKK